MAASFGYVLLPEAQVSAHMDGSAPGAELEMPEAATQAMIDFALDMKTASEYTVYAEKGVIERGSSEIKGAKGGAMRSAAGRKSARDLANAIDAMRQLPCTELEINSFAGRTFTPGVYCLNSAELDGQMTIDGQGAAAGTFIFRVMGSLTVRNASSVRLENGTQSGNVYFAADDAEIGENAAFRAHLLTSGSIKIGSGTTMTDKVMAKNDGMSNTA